MIKYYRVEGFNYEYYTIYASIVEYYLLKEGWIKCSDYKEDFNDSYYILDSYGTPGTREDYCILKEKFKDEEMYESLEKAKKDFIKQLDKFYKKECLKLLKAYQEILIENGINNSLKGRDKFGDN
jgi:hypothetical protein